MKYVREITTSGLRVSLREDGIIETRNHAGFQGPDGIENAIENMKAVTAISEGTLRPILNYLPDHYVTDEAQEYYANHPPAALASAMIAKSFIQKLIGNFLINFKKLPIPTRMFEDDEKAVQWLMEHWEEHKNLTRGEESP